MAIDYESQLGELVKLLQTTQTPTVGGDPLSLFMTGLGAGMLPGMKSTEMILGLANRDREIQQKNLQNRIAAAEMGGLLQKVQQQRAGQEAAGQFMQGQPELAALQGLAKVNPQLAMQLGEMLQKTQQRGREQQDVATLSQRLGVPVQTMEGARTVAGMEDREANRRIREAQVANAQVNTELTGLMKQAQLGEMQEKQRVKQERMAAFPEDKQIEYANAQQVISSIPGLSEQERKQLDGVASRMVRAVSPELLDASKNQFASSVRSALSTVDRRRALEAPAIENRFKAADSVLNSTAAQLNKLGVDVSKTDTFFKFSGASKQNDAQWAAIRSSVERFNEASDAFNKAARDRQKFSEQYGLGLEMPEPKGRYTIDTKLGRVSYVPAARLDAINAGAAAGGAKPAAATPSQERMIELNISPEAASAITNWLGGAK